MVKFLAIPFMICIHFYEQFGSFDHAVKVPDTFFRNAMEFAGGPLAAPVFMFSMGIGMIYTHHDSPREHIKRGWKLLLTGYLLNFFRQTLPQLIEGLLGMMKEIADKHGIDRSQIPILWAIAKGAVPIVGITKPSYAKKLSEALKVNLTDEEIDRLTEEARRTGIRQQGSWEPQ